MELQKKRIKVYDAISNLGSGSITVNLTPSSGQWNINGGSWQNSGVTVSGILIGTHTINYKGLVHADSTKVYVTPSSETVSISFDGDNKLLNKTYLEKDKPQAIIKTFNLDTKSDILLRNKNDGRHVVMQMDGSTVSPALVKLSNGNDHKPNYSIWFNR